MKFRQKIQLQIGKHYEYRDTINLTKNVVLITSINPLIGTRKKEDYYGPPRRGFWLSTSGMSFELDKRFTYRPIEYEEPSNFEQVYSITNPDANDATAWNNRPIGATFYESISTNIYDSISTASSNTQD